MKRDAQRRLSERVALGAFARIVDGESCVVDCKVLDLSGTGARLEIPWRSRIPNEFTLCVPSRGIERRVEVIWGSGDELGVHFLFDSQPGATEVPVLPSAAAPKPVVAERETTDLPIPRRTDDFRDLATRSRVQSRISEPIRFGAMLRGPVLWFTLVILGVFGAGVVIWPKFERSASTNHVLTAERSGDETARQRGPQIPSNNGQPDESTATLAPVEGIGSTFLGVLDRAGGKVTETLTRNTSGDLAVSGNRPSESRSNKDLAPAPPVSQPPRTLSPLPADSLGPAAFAQPVIPALRPAPPGERPAASSAALTITISQLGDSELQAVKDCLSTVMNAEPLTEWRSLPHFVVADTCLQRRVTAGQKPPQQVNAKPPI